MSFEEKRKMKFDEPMRLEMVDGMNEFIGPDHKLGPWDRECSMVDNPLRTVINAYTDGFCHGYNQAKQELEKR